MRSESRTRISLDQFRVLQSLASSTRSEIAEFMVSDSEEPVGEGSGEENERRGNGDEEIEYGEGGEGLWHVQVTRLNFGL